MLRFSFLRCATMGVVFGAALLLPMFASAQTVSLSYLGQDTIASGQTFQNTTVGGLSGITYQAQTDTYYVISDDRNNARYYSVNINLSNNQLQDNGTTVNAGGVQFTGVTTLKQSSGQGFANGSFDAEGITLSGSSLYVSSEQQVGGAFLHRFDPASGNQQGTVTLPSKYTPGTNTGLRSNLAFETLTRTPGGKLITATENALAQDGSTPGLFNSSPSRIAVINEATGAVEAEYVYDVGAGLAVNGLTDMLAINDTTLLALERYVNAATFSLSTRIYQISLNGATNVSGVNDLQDLPGGYTAVNKQLVFDLATVTTGSVNAEGLTFGPTLANGQQSLILVADDNFGASAVGITVPTRFLAFAVVPGPEALPLFGMGLASLGLVLRRRTRRVI